MMKIDIRQEDALPALSRATKVVFLDRDGTINDAPQGYISKPEDFQLYPFAAEAIRQLNDLGLKTIVVSNQSGIARGFFSEADLEKVHTFMKEELAKEKAFIDLILYSPYHPEGVIAPFNIEHRSRKPGSGMFFEALKKFSFKANQSYMIGDNYVDIEYGKKHGLITFLVKTGFGTRIWEKIANSASREYTDNINVYPDFIVENILSAANVIKILERQK